MQPAVGVEVQDGFYPQAELTNCAHKQCPFSVQDDAHITYAWPPFAPYAKAVCGPLGSSSQVSSGV
jgi:hypothetical protein